MFIFNIMENLVGTKFLNRNRNERERKGYKLSDLDSLITRSHAEQVMISLDTCDVL